MILSVTLNPVVDTTFFVEAMRPIYRTEASRVTHLTGGKGTNVTRALRCLGEDGQVLIALGGKMGRVAADALAEEGLSAAIAWISGETRLMITVVDQDSNQRAFFAPNTPFTSHDVTSVQSALDPLLHEADSVCLCGSSPAPEADELFAYVIQQAHLRHLPTILDSSGGGLRHGLSASPAVVKINLSEIEGLLGRSLPTMADRLRALDELRAKGPQWAIITTGESGALMSSAEGEYWAVRPPKMDVINPIGCGDAMTAGLALAMRRQEAPPECLRYATAVAAANALSWDACLFDPANVAALLPQVELGAFGSVGELD